MLVISISKVNYIFLFWAYNLLYLESIYELVCRIRFIILNNTKFEGDSDLITYKWNEFSYIQKRADYHMINYSDLYSF